MLAPVLMNCHTVLIAVVLQYVFQIPNLKIYFRFLRVSCNSIQISESIFQFLPLMKTPGNGTEFTQLWTGPDFNQLRNQPCESHRGSSLKPVLPWLLSSVGSVDCSQKANGITKESNIAHQRQTLCILMFFTISLAHYRFSLSLTLHWMSAQLMVQPLAEN